MFFNMLEDHGEVLLLGKLLVYFSQLVCSTNSVSFAVVQNAMVETQCYS